MDEFNNIPYFRRFKESDAPIFIQNLEIEKVYEHMRAEFPRTRNEVKDFIIASEKGETNNFAIEYKDSLVGMISLFHKNGEPGSFEIGCMWIFKQFLGLGIATYETKKFVIKAFDEYKASKVYICTYEENKAPQRIISNMGFIFYSYSWYKNNKKLCYYEMTRKQFEKNREIFEVTWEDHRRKLSPNL